MAHDVDWYIGLMNELDEEFLPVVRLFDKIDEMVRPQWALPADFTAVVKDVMAIVDTAPSDAINGGAITLSGALPIFSFTPFAPNAADYDRVEKLEDTVSTHFKKSNHRGDGSVMYDIAESSLKYNTICVRTDDLCHILPKDPRKWSTLQKRAWSYGRFIHKPINPKNVKYIHSDLGLTLVGHTETYKVSAIVKYWELYENNDTDEGKRIARALKDLKAAAGENINSKDLFFEQTYCIDDDRLMIWGELTAQQDVNADSTVSQDEFVFVDQENNYGFLPWSIRVAGSRLEQDIAYRVNPLLAPLYWSGSWDKLNMAKSIIFSEPIRRARSPRGASFTDSGEPPQIDYETGADIAMRKGDDYKTFQPISMDEQALAIVGALESAMNRTTGASMIGDTTKISSNTPFATYSAMIKVALSRIDKQRHIMAMSCEDMACNMLWWADKTDKPLSSYSVMDKRMRSGKMMARGTKIEITKDDYDLYNLGISAKIKPATPTDAMEQLNSAVILSTKLNVPVSDLLQEMGYENVGLMYERWAKEFMSNAQIQADARGLMAQAEAMAQVNAQQQMQANSQQQQQSQEQPPQGAEQGISQTSFGALGGMGEGVNPAMAGMSPTQAAPTMGREQVTGRNYSQSR